MRPWRSSLVAAALAIIGASSQASTNLAGLQNIDFGFVDLNPGDGIDPSLLDVPGEVLSGYSVLLDGYFPGGPGLVTDGFLTAGDVDFPYDPGLAAGASGSMSGGRISVQAEAAGSGTAHIGGSAGGNYFLTPHTRVTLTADAVLQASGDAGSEFVSVCLDSCSSDTWIANGIRTRFLSVTFSNDTDGFVPLSASVAVDAFASGVPELPTSVLLLSAGVLFAWKPVNRRLRGPDASGR
jgi:hypothetical protein